MLMKFDGLASLVDMQIHVKTMTLLSSIVIKVIAKTVNIF